MDTPFNIRKFLLAVLVVSLWDALLIALKPK
jgi:hypothetical protein